jgi:autoinducer 2-degrading protein
MALLHTAHLRVRREAIELFRERLILHARTSLEREPGCHVVDTYQKVKDPTLFLLIEVYADDAALDAHRKSPHYLQFREDVKDWIVERKWWFWEKCRLETPMPPGEEISASRGNPSALR